MRAPKVYIALQQFCENDDRAIRVLTEAGFDVQLNKFGRRLKKEEMAEVLHGFDAVLAGVEPYNKELLQKLNGLKCISRCGVGTDAVDLDAAKTLNISVYKTVQEVVQPVAEMTTAMILSMARNLQLHTQDFQSEVWKKRYGVLMSEWTLGFIGFGRIARKVEELLKPFNSKILVHDPFLKAASLPSHIKLVSLDDLLAQSNLITLHAARPAEEGPILGKSEISKMKNGVCLVNTARGNMLDEAALVAALKEGKVAGVAMDVFEKEPYKGPLKDFPQVIATPHVSTLTRKSRAEMELASAQHIVTHFSNEN